MLLGLDKRHVSLLTLLDLSSAFDLNILLDTQIICMEFPAHVYHGSVHICQTEDSQ